MARGWESKSVEAQQADHQRREAPQGLESADDRARLVRQRTVELALIRARADLAVATAPGHRAMLERAIATLELQVRQEFGVDPATIE